jgi:hypothetical protein
MTHKSVICKWGQEELIFRHSESITAEAAVTNSDLALGADPLPPNSNFVADLLFVARALLVE